MIDVDIAQTFLKVAETNSFQAAAKALNVTQSTVSARIRALEDRLGRRLFERSRFGAELNEHGLAFRRYAAAIVHAWEEGRRVAASGASSPNRLSVGGEHNFWTRMLPLWLLEIRGAIPGVAVGATAADASCLLEGVKQRTIDIAVIHRPANAEGLTATHLMDDELVLVTTDPSGAYEERYVDLAWPGSDAETAAFGGGPDRMRVDLGFHAINYLMVTQAAGYLPRRLVDPYVEAGYLYRAAAPTVLTPVHAVHRTDSGGDTFETALALLRDVAGLASRGELPPPFWSQMG
jgi:DNA-binding transcriptional LysR family regulator